MLSWTVSNQRQSLFHTSLIIFFAAFLSACTCNDPCVSSKVPIGPKEYDVSPLACRGDPCDKSKNTCNNSSVYQKSSLAIKDTLESQGVTVVVLGDQILIVVPSSRIFKSGTSTIKPTGYRTLYTVVQYINRFYTMAVKVAAYTNDTGSKCVDEVLSQQQAQNVAKTLEGYGVDARVLFAAGYGGTHLVAKNTLDWDHSANYRIEITLEKLYV